MPLPRSLRVGFVGLLSLALASLATATDWEQAHSDIPAWAGASFGVLDNGLRYVIIPTQAQKNEVSYRLVVAAGSLEETDTQQGYAHFIEHMAFRSSTHFRGDQKFQWLQRLGSMDGADVNAETDFEATVYKFNVPTNDPSVQENALLLLADISSELMFNKDELDVERNVILSEALTRHSAAADHLDEEIGFLYEGTLLPHRKPIGTEDAVAGATPGQLQAFYDTWYRPELMTLVVVGDVDPAAIETTIHTRFGSLAPRAAAASYPSWGPATRANVPGVKVIPGGVGMRLTLGTFYEHEPVPETQAEWRSDLRTRVGNKMLSLRLDALSKAADSPVVRAESGNIVGYGPAREEVINVNGSMDNWRQALDLADQELRRALEFGFSKTELSRAELGFEDTNRRALNNAGKLLNPQIADYAVGQIRSHQVVADPSFGSRIMLEELPHVTAEECRQAVRERWGSGPHFVLLRDGVQGDGLTSEAVTFELNKSERVRVTPPPAAAAERAFPYPPAEKPAEVITSATDPVGTWHGQFSNGIRLNVKPTQNLSDTIHVRLRIGSGLLVEPADKPGLGVFAGLATITGGVNKMTNVELRDYNLANGIELNVEDDARSALVVDATVTASRATALFAVLSGYLKDASFQPSVQPQVSGLLNGEYYQRRQSSIGLVQLKLGRALMGGDARFSFPPPSAYLKYSMADAAAFMRPILASADIEVSVVGPISPEAAQAAVGRTLGQLPAREPRLTIHQLRQPKVAKLPSRVISTYEADTQDARAIICLCWKVPSPVDPSDSPSIDLLSHIIADRVKARVRVELGKTYSPWITFNWMTEVPSYAFCACVVDTRPADVIEVEKATKAVVMEVVKNGVTLDEVVTQRTTLLKSLESDAHDDGVIMDDIEASQSLPRLYEATLNQPMLLGACTPASLTAKAREIFKDDALATLIFVPVGQTPKH